MRGKKERSANIHIILFFEFGVLFTIDAPQNVTRVTPNNANAKAGFQFMYSR